MAGFPGESGQLARFSLQLFKLYSSATSTSKSQEVLNSLNSLLEFNYITSFVFLGILKMFCIPCRSRNLDQLRYPTLFTLSSDSRAMNIYQLTATFILFWINIGCKSIKGSYRHLFWWTATGKEARKMYFCQVLGLCK